MNDKALPVQFPPIAPPRPRIAGLEAGRADGPLHRACFENLNPGRATTIAPRKLMGFRRVSATSKRPDTCFTTTRSSTCPIASIVLRCTPEHIDTGTVSMLRGCPRAGPSKPATGSATELRLCSLIRRAGKRLRPSPSRRNDQFYVSRCVIAGSGARRIPRHARRAPAGVWGCRSGDT